MASRLEQLPSELLLALMGFIRRPSDLRALCLTSKTIHTCALEALYFQVGIDYDTECKSPEAAKSLLQIGNPGLAHIREVDIIAPGDLEDCDAEVQFLGRFLSVLPRDGLKHIACYSSKLDEPTISTLLTQQQNLESISLGPVMCDFAELLNTSTLSWPSLKTLVVPQTIGDTDLEAYKSIIEHAPHLSDLTIECLSEYTPALPFLISLSHSPKMLEIALLGDATSGEDLPLLKLKRLSLNHVCAGDNYTSRLDLSILRSLCLWQCSDANTVMAAITSSASKGECALEAFIYHAGHHSSFDHTSVTMMLRSFTGLKKLHLDRSESDRAAFDLGCLDGHKNTLESVFLGCGHIDTLNKENLRGLDIASFASFPKLRYLAVPMPATTVPFVETPNSQKYITLFASLMAIPKLGVLRILNYPRATPIKDTSTPNSDQSSEVHQLSLKDFMRDLDHFVQTKLAQHIRGSTVLCFGAGRGGSDTTSDGKTEVTLHPSYYVTKQHMDVSGNSQTSISRTSLRETRYVAPGILGEMIESFESMWDE